MPNAQNAHLVTKQNTKHCIILPNANNVKTKQNRKHCIGKEIALAKSFSTKRRGAFQTLRGSQTSKTRKLAQKHF
jgi:hypothetical protein